MRVYEEGEAYLHRSYAETLPQRLWSAPVMLPERSLDLPFLLSTVETHRQKEILYYFKKLDLLSCFSNTYEVKGQKRGTCVTCIDVAGKLAVNVSAS